MPRRHFGGLLGSMMLALGVLPPLPEHRPRVVGGPAERGGDLFVGDERVRIEEGDTAEIIQGRIDEAIQRNPMEPRKSLTVGPTLPTDETDVVGRVTIGDEVIKVRAGESQEDVQRRVDASLERQRRGITVANEPYGRTTPGSHWPRTWTRRRGWGLAATATYAS